MRCVKYFRNARIARNARSELALNYTQGPWLRCLRCVRCVRCVRLETGFEKLPGAHQAETGKQQQQHLDFIFYVQICLLFQGLLLRSFIRISK